MVTITASARPPRRGLFVLAFVLLVTMLLFQLSQDRRAVDHALDSSLTSSASASSSTTAVASSTTTTTTSSSSSSSIGSTFDQKITPDLKGRGDGTSRRHEEDDNKNTPSALKQSESNVDDLAAQALAFVMSRQAAYQQAGMEISWNFRGVGYLYSRHQVILAATIVMDKGQKKKSVHIYNVHPNARQNQQEQARNDCDKFTIWVRVYGPEIFADNAKAVDAQGSADCFWKFDFEPSVPGEYAVDAKSLLWNSKHRDYEEEQQCLSWEEEESGDERAMMLQKQYPKHSGFRGFKFYNPQFFCCEICNRLAPYCQMWANPPWKMGTPSKKENGCELFFKDDTPEEYIPKSWMLGDINVSFPELPVENKEHKQQRRRLVGKMTYGRPHEGEPQYFVGCGWSIWFSLDFPCLSGELDDMVFLLANTFQLSVDDLPKQQQLGRDGNGAELPLCGPDIEFMRNSNGRWVQEAWSSSEGLCPQFRIDSGASKHFDIVVHDGKNPHCWHRDDLSHIGEQCLEMNCRHVNPLSTWNSRARVNEWLGVWREHSCDYVEFTNDELQRCIDTKKIKRIATEGLSIAKYFKQYLEQRVSGLQLYEKKDDPDAIEVILSSVGLVHRLANNDTEDFWNYLRKRYPPANRNRRVFVVNGFYLSSERAVYAHVERMVDLNDQVVERKFVQDWGYELLNVFNLSAAFTYDTATQRDGMHLIGPPMKMAITKMFHYLCHDVVSGSRV